MIIKTEEKATEHPFEMILGIETGTTMAEYTEVIPTQQVEMIHYHDKDNEIEEKIEEVYALALSAAQTTSDQLELVEGKYKASLAESATQALNIALGAIREKRLLSEHKDKLAAQLKKQTGPVNTTNNNLIVGSRNEIMKLLADQRNQSK